MDIQDLVRRTRSFRRFHEDHAIGMDVLEQLVDLARLAGSGRNIQALKFMVCNDRERNARIFPEVAWAGYLRDWPGPGPGERPSAYIIVLGDRSLAGDYGFGPDPGIASQNIMLGATSLGLGGCMMTSFRRERLPKVLALPEHLEIQLVIALGRPREEVRLEPMGPDGDVKYWRDAAGVHHVPKRSLEEVLLRF